MRLVKLKLASTVPLNLSLSLCACSAHRFQVIIPASSSWGSPWSVSPSSQSQPGSKAIHFDSQILTFPGHVAWICSVSAGDACWERWWSSVSSCSASSWSRCSSDSRTCPQHTWQQVVLSLCCFGSLSFYLWGTLSGSFIFLSPLCSAGKTTVCQTAGMHEGMKDGGAFLPLTL